MYRKKRGGGGVITNSLHPSVLSHVLCPVFLLLSTYANEPCKWGESDHPACSPPVSFSVHLTNSAVSPAGSVHASRDDNVVRMWVQLTR